MAAEFLDGRLPERDCKRKPNKEHLHAATRVNDSSDPGGINEVRNKEI
jgi:hypothetical protein